MHKDSVFKIVGCLILILGFHWAQAETGAKKSSDQQEALTQWLWRSENPLHQAVAIRIAEPGFFSASEIESRLDALIASADSEPLVEMLTTACQKQRSMAFCANAGLDEAIVQNANGNLMLRGLMSASHEDWASTVRETPSASDPTLSIARSVHAAFSDFLNATGQLDDDHHYSSQAFAVAMATVVPFNRVTETCFEPTDLIVDACLNIESELAEPTNTLLAQALGLALQRERLKRHNETELAAALEAHRVALMEYAQCIRWSLPTGYEAHLSQDQIATWFELSVDAGEIAATEFLGELFDVECTLEPALDIDVSADRLSKILGLESGPDRV